MKIFFTTMILASVLSAWGKNINPKAGLWRINIQYPHTQIPFLIEFEAQKKGWKAILINGKEHIPLEEIKVVKNKWIIPLGTYQNFLELSFLSKTELKGHFVKAAKFPNEKIPIHGAQGEFRRFDKPSIDPLINLNGKWSMQLTGADGKVQNVIAVFGQTGQTIDATILTPSGDLRYLDGYVSGNKFQAAGFDGVFNYLFKGELVDSKLKGELISKSISTFSAKLDPKAELEKNQQTSLEQLSFSFKNLDGALVQLTDDKYKDKAIVLQIFGSWCPNCIDETVFLTEWYKNSKFSKPVEIICLAFELHQTETDAIKHLKKFATKRNVHYPILLAGWNETHKPETTIHGLKNFNAFPTTIFLDKKHQVVKIHSGFSGPGTGDYYRKFQLDFLQTIESIIR